MNWFALRRAFCWVLGHKYLKYIAFNKDGGPEFITGWTCYVCLRERP